MITLDKERVDAAFKQINEFEHGVPGIRFGDDYPSFALAVVGSEAFNKLVKGTTLIGMLGVMFMPKKEAGEKLTEDEATKIFEKSPMREEVLKILYLGYKLGKGESQ